MLSLLFILCSALSKEIGITAVAICLFYELLIHRKVCIKQQSHDMYSLSLVIIQLNVGDISAAVRSAQMPMWCVRLIASAFILGIFAIAFLALRLVLNQGPPRLTFV